MKNYIPFTILIISLWAVNCSNRKENPGNENKNSNEIVTQILDFPEAGEDTLKTSVFADTVIFIPLETTEESFMDYIEQIWIDDSFILIECRQAGLLLFQQDGKFLRKIGKRGRGPGEYGIIYSFFVIQDTIYVSSTSRRGFLRYTFDGTFCDEIKLNYEPVFFNTTIDQKLACYCMEEGKIYVYNNNLYMPPDTITVEYGVTEGRYRYVFTSDKTMIYLQKYSKGLLFYDYMSDTVWNITGVKKEPAYIVNMKNKLPRDKHIEFCNGNTKGWSQMVTSYELVHLLPFSSCMFVYQKYWRGPKFDAIYLINTKTGGINRYNRTWIFDDIVSRQRLWVFDYVYADDYLVATTYPPEEDPANSKGNAGTAPSPLWLELVKDLKLDDNPILVKVKLKKNIQ